MSWMCALFRGTYQDKGIVLYATITFLRWGRRRCVGMGEDIVGRGWIPWVKRSVRAGLDQTRCVNRGIGVRGCWLWLDYEILALSIYHIGCTGQRSHCSTPVDLGWDCNVVFYNKFAVHFNKYNVQSLRSKGQTALGILSGVHPSPWAGNKKLQTMKQTAVKRFSYILESF